MSVFLEKSGVGRECNKKANGTVLKCVEIKSSMKLRIFSDRQYLLDGMEPDPMLYPFWSPSLDSNQSPWLRQYENYVESGHSFFEMVPLEEADFAIIPANWRTIRGDSWRSKVNKQAVDLSIQFAEKAEQANKKVIVFFSGDCSDEEVPVKNALVFRISLYRSQKKPNDFVPPAFCEDLVKHYLGNQLPIRQKQEKPVVGFCGLVQQDSWQTKVKTLVYHGAMLARQGRMGVSPYKGQILRAKALKILADNPLVDTNFVTRNRAVFFKGDLDQKQKVRVEFVQNMAQSDYILCCRGSANYSNRLFEVLSCGRIPVFIDTDCVLPFEFAIDWKKYCVWVDEKELPRIAEKIAEFHNKLSPQEFVELQYECRKLWKEWLSPEGFFANFYRHFQGSTYQKVENTGVSEIAI